MISVLIDSPAKVNHYHGATRKECLTVLKRLEEREEGHLLEIWQCLTHGNVEICRCGYEWGHHYDTLS